MKKQALLHFTYTLSKVIYIPGPWPLWSPCSHRKLPWTRLPASNWTFARGFFEPRRMHSFGAGQRSFQCPKRHPLLPSDRRELLNFSKYIDILVDPSPAFYRRLVEQIRRIIHFVQVMSVKKRRRFRIRNRRKPFWKRFVFVVDKEKKPGGTERRYKLLIASDNDFACCEGWTWGWWTLLGRQYERLPGFNSGGGVA